MSRRLHPAALPALLLLPLLALACTPGAPEPPTSGASAPDGEPRPQRNAYFGDLHVHSRYSFDAFIFATRVSPDDAYRYARGEAIEHPAGFTVQLESPLDFYAVTDHAEFLGIMPALADPEQAISQHELGRNLAALASIEDRGRYFRSLPSYMINERYKEVLDFDIVRSAWQEIIAAAQRHYEPGTFTTFVGYEYTSAPGSQNLHRNVIFRGNALPDLPFSQLDSENPEKLWTWLDEMRDEGIEGLAIPHNSNGSNGQMFRLDSFAGAPLSAEYAALRMRNEPLVEITQVKGTSDTHPLLSPNDEWAEFEIFPYRISTTMPSEPRGSYVRDAYLQGLKMEDELGFNPFRFGVIGSSDTHNGATSVEEKNFFSKIGVMDGTAQARGSVPLDRPGADGERYAQTYYRLWGASGLVGVWAEENSRESIYDAFRRKETFATSGPRIRVRLFAGYDLPEGIADDPEMIATAYAAGVPMGADLMVDGDRTPRLLVHASRDPNSAPLQRLQVIKGWIEAGAAHEEVFDVACSDGGRPDPATHRCPDNGAAVDLADCSFSDGAGAGELEALWNDPTFDASQRALYYVRVLENPTCRWSTWDAIRAGVEPRPDLPETIQERAWSSPIWFVPGE